MKSSRHILTIGAMACALTMLVGNAHAQQVPIPKTAAEVPGPAPGPMPKAYVEMGIRAYWADQAILDGTWQPPAIEKVN